MWGNTDWKNSKYGHSLRSVKIYSMYWINEDLKIECFNDNIVKKFNYYKILLYILLYLIQLQFRVSSIFSKINLFTNVLLVLSSTLYVIVSFFGNAL